MKNRKRPQNKAKGQEKDKQGILKLKIEGTNEELTEKGGLIELGEFMDALALRKELRRQLRKAESDRGYESLEYIEPLYLIPTG